MKYFLFALLSITIIHGASASSAIPENDLYIPADTKEKSNITEEEFLDIVTEIEALYAHEEITFLKYWEDGTVNAYAQIYDSKRYISVFGGFARYSKMTKGAFAMVLCHEVGHHLGGAPRMSSSWASAEGQADYFASSKCMKRFLADKNNMEFVSSLTKKDFEAASVGCKKVYNDEKDYALCIRNSIAGRDLGVVFGSFEPYLTLMPAIDTPTSFTVSKTNKDKYPSQQCRLDTFIRGALCDVDPDLQSDAYKPFASYCKDGIGARPRCWFAPSDYN